MTNPYVGDIVPIIRNDAGLYDGNLIHYFRVVFLKSQNIRNAYHNLRHMLHVLWLCNRAVLYYQKTETPLTQDQVRVLFIAALFHDFDHSGQLGEDDLNIERACRGLVKNILGRDADLLWEILECIRQTQYPHVRPSEHLTLSQQILRDADMSQALSVAWLQQVVVGLATEWSKSPVEVLRAQGGFHRSLSFSTAWANSMFPPEVIEAKIAEAEALLGFLEE